MKRKFSPGLIVVAAATAVLGITFLPGCGGGSTSTPTITARPKPRAGGGPAKTVQNGAGKKNGGAAAGGVGTLKGVIRFTGTAPKPGKPPGYVPKAYCMNPDIEAKIIDDSFQVGANGGLKNVIIYVDRKPRGYSPPPVAGEVAFDNIYCMFKPRVLAVRVNQPIRVGNKDKTAHNTHTNPLAGTGFNQNIAPGQSATFAYDAVARVPVKVNCDIHPWMLAWQLPLDHNIVAVTDDNGQFEIKDLPAGTYRFNIWHEKAGGGGFLERGVTVTIQGGENTFNREYGSNKFSFFGGGAAPSAPAVVLHLDR